MVVEVCPAAIVVFAAAALARALACLAVCGAGSVGPPSADRWCCHRRDDFAGFVSAAFPTARFQPRDSLSRRL